MGGWGFSSVVECLPSKLKALGSVLSSGKEKKKKKKTQDGKAINSALTWSLPYSTSGNSWQLAVTAERQKLMESIQGAWTYRVQDTYYAKAPNLDPV